MYSITRMIGFFKKLFSAHDMTEGAPWQRLAEFAFPMLLGNLAQQLYNTVDSIVVGKYIGDDALAAVGSASPILNLLLALFVGVSTGAGIVVSQHYGAGDRERLSEAIGNCVTLGAIASVATMVIGACIARPLLELLNTDPTIIDWCTDYLIVFFLGAVGFTFYNILSGILRGMGGLLLRPGVPGHCHSAEHWPGRVVCGRLSDGRARCGSGHRAGSGDLRGAVFCQAPLYAGCI